MHFDCVWQVRLHLQLVARLRNCVRFQVQRAHYDRQYRVGVFVSSRDVHTKGVGPAAEGVGGQGKETARHVLSAEGLHNARHRHSHSRQFSNQPSLRPRVLPPRLPLSKPYVSLERPAHHYPIVVVDGVGKAKDGGESYGSEETFLHLADGVHGVLLEALPETDQVHVCAH